MSKTLKANEKLEKKIQKEIDKLLSYGTLGLTDDLRLAYCKYIEQLHQEQQDFRAKIEERIEETQPKLTNGREFENWKQGQREAFEEVLTLLDKDNKH